MSVEILLPIAATHPAFAGHFPGRPIVPGVVLLDEALYAIGRQTGSDLSACDISNVKFVSPVMPGEAVTVRYDTTPRGGIRFDILCGERKAATGLVRPRDKT